MTAMNNNRKRSLAFETLGDRCAPSTILVGSAIVPPNAESEIEIMALSAPGDPLIRTLNMRAQLGDGRGPGSEPVFKNVSYEDTIWTDSEVQILGGVIEDEPQFVQSTILLMNPEESSLQAQGLLAHLVIDTHGFTRGTFELRLADTIFGDSDFGANSADVVNGTIKIASAGDANLDGKFDSSDLVKVLTIGEYEDGVPANSTWTEGDWNGDREFNSSDFVYALQNGSYER